MVRTVLQFLEETGACIKLQTAWDIRGFSNVEHGSIHMTHTPTTSSPVGSCRVLHFGDGPSDNMATHTAFTNMTPSSAQQPGAVRPSRLDCAKPRRRRSRSIDPYRSRSRESPIFREVHEQLIGATDAHLDVLRLQSFALALRPVGPRSPRRDIACG